MVTKPTRHIRTYSGRSQSDRPGDQFSHHNRPTMRRGSGSGRNRGEAQRRRGPRPVRGRWEQNPTNTPGRRGSGLTYGDIDLTPHDHYTVASTGPREGNLRVAVIGGNEEIGRNMTMIEYGHDIILIDMGIQFPEEGMLGVDSILPNLSYLKGKEDRVKAVVITHAHNDHIGAIPFLMPTLPGVPLFSSPFTLAVIAKKLEYHPEVKVDMRAIDNDTVLELGVFKLSFFGVSHSVPSSHAVIIDTPNGRLVHTGDFKLDHEPQDAEGKANLQRLKDLGSENVLALMADSTNASTPGFQVMEREVESNLDKVFTEAKGRLIVGMISTNVLRLGQMIKLAEQYGRYVAIEGLSMKNNLEIAEQLGFVQYNPETIVDVKKLTSFAKNQVMVICSGAQGESNAAFSRIAEGKHPVIEIMPGDTVVFSSSVIPGNERTVQSVTDKFYRQGAKVINVKMLDIHAGGHARQDDLREVIKHVKPKYLIPIEGMHSFLHAHAEAGIAAGLSAENIFIADNGQIMEFNSQGIGHLTSEYLNTDYVFVDGNTIDEVDRDTLAERKRLGEEGIIIITLGWKDVDLYGLVHVKTLGFRKNSLIARTIQNVTIFVENQLKRIPKAQRHNIPRWRQMIEDKLSEELGQALNRNPYVIVNVLPIK